MATNAFNLQDTIVLLERTPLALSALLRGLPDTWILRNEGESTWNAFEIVGHLIYGERADWMVRARLILERDETRTFEPFDRLGFVELSQGRTLESLLEEFGKLRQQNLTALRTMALQPADLELRARHPALGPVTLQELLATWVAHDLTHLHELSRVMAYQYRDAVGPWRAYLGVMHCNGHSAP